MYLCFFLFVICVQFISFKNSFLNAHYVLETVLSFDDGRNKLGKGLCSLETVFLYTS